MKALVIRKYEESYGEWNEWVEEVWIFQNEELDYEELVKQHKDNKEEFPKLYQWLEFNGGLLIDFDDILI